jgi:polyferredoxin
LQSKLKTLNDNKWRYASMVAGFFLFVAPFAFFTQLVFNLMGNTVAPTLHTLCLRMPFSNLFSGNLSSLIGSVAAVFVAGIIVVAFIASPLFCGWLCPIGAASEGASRAVPLPSKFRLNIKDPKVTRGLRFGFLAGFAFVAIFAAYNVLGGAVASICCRYCPSSIVQNVAYGATGNLDVLSYWTSGSLLTLGSWLFLGGVLFAGGRGWCLFLCPVGAMSGLAHKVGSKLGLYSVKFDESKCHNCAECSVKCPMWAVGEDKSVDSTLCIGCQECTHACTGGAYKYTRGKVDVKPN